MPETTEAEIVLREALPEDGAALMEAIGRIDEETEFLGKPGEYRRWSEGVATRLAEMRRRATGAYVLALHGGEIVGFLGAFTGAVERARGLVYVGHVGLRRAWRGRGIGTRLFAAIEEWALAHGGWRLELRVDEANERGLALYRKRGFVIEGRIAQAVRLDGRWHAHYWMAKVLRELEGPAWAPLDLPPLAAPAAGAVTIRRLEPQEAALLCRWARRFLAETPFLLKQPQEVPDEAAVAKGLADDRDKPDRLALAVVAGDSVVGHATIWKEPSLRMQHDATFVLSLERDQWGRGLGRALYAQLERWARDNGALRLSTTVLGHNLRALRFAAAQGLQPEVTSPRCIPVDGRVADRLRLGKLLI